MENFNQKTQLIWNIADILRGGWHQYEYQNVILPLVVLKRLDSILADSKQKVLDQNNEYKGRVDVDPILKKISGVGFYNVSPFDFKKLTEEPSQVAANFSHYLNGFSENIRDIFEKFDFSQQFEKLKEGNILFLIIQELNKVNLHPSVVDNHQMGLIFEELLRKFSEMSNETAGEHYTPRDVIKLMVEVLLNPDLEDLKRPHLIRTIYDPACGTGGMLTVAKDYILENVGTKADVFLYGQELNSVTYAMAKSDMLIKGENPDYIRGGEKDHSKASTLANDQFFGESFDYGLCNPPYGVDWKKDKQTVEKEADRGFAGRFGAGTPRISDGQLLFLQHLVSKMRPVKDGGSRIAIVHNGSPLFTGDAGSGESEIRRWVLEKDYLETIIALPDQLFYNTGINTYLWFLSNRKSVDRKGKVQLIDGRKFFDKMRKSLGSKRHSIGDNDRTKILKIYQEFKDNEFSKIFDATDFGYRQITVERPLRLNFQISPERLSLLNDPELTAKFASFPTSKIFTNREEFLSVFDPFVRPLKLKSTDKKKILSAISESDETADTCKDGQGNVEADPSLRDTENVPLGTDIYEYFDKEVKPYVADAWINETVRDPKDNQIGKVGYEIPFTRYFYTYQYPRDISEIGSDIENVETELINLLKQI